MAMPPLNLPGGECWAASLGECEGPITGEHLITEALFANRVRVEGAGAPWLPSTAFDISIRRLKANILCRKHNGELGRTADASALRLYRALRHSERPIELPGSHILRQPVRRVIRGAHLARWLCKTHCNFMVAACATPDADYVRYAFGRPTKRRLGFFVAAALGDYLRFADARDPVVRYQQLLQPDTEGFDGFIISIGGLPIVGSNFGVARNGRPMIDRIRELIQPTPLGPYVIEFDWGGEPGIQAA
jgi:hypothetical protein